ncbi:MAG: hypothetical protein PHQ34_03105 [Methanothrix sp.]|nr:hypothetical protein [Methanothrix sp.]
MNASQRPSVRMNLSARPSLMVIAILPMLFCGCIGDNNNKPPEDSGPSVALGTHLNITNMGPYAIGLNLNDNNEYYPSDIKIENGSVKTGPPDCFSYSNYTRYQRDILDKKSGNRSLSLVVEQYEDVAQTDDNLLELGLSRWPWGESNHYKLHFIGDRKWIIFSGPQEDEIDAACWIDDNTILSMRMFNIIEGDCIAILGSITERSQ